MEDRDDPKSQYRATAEPQLTEAIGDWVLALLLDSWSASGISMSITVQCGGLLVTGSPIPDNIYFGQLGRIIGEAAREGPIQTRTGVSIPEDIDIAEVVEQLGRALENTLTEIGVELHDRVRNRFFSQEIENAVGRDGLVERPRAFINLERATIWNGHDNEIDVPLWRGRLADVSSWYMGRHGISPYRDE